METNTPIELKHCIKIENTGVQIVRHTFKRGESMGYIGKEGVTPVKIGSFEHVHLHVPTIKGVSDFTITRRAENEQQQEVMDGEILNLFEPNIGNCLAFARYLNHSKCEGEIEFNFELKEIHVKFTWRGDIERDGYLSSVCTCQSDPLDQMLSSLALTRKFFATIEHRNIYKMVDTAYCFVVVEDLNKSLKNLVIID